MKTVNELVQQLTDSTNMSLQQTAWTTKLNELLVAEQLKIDVGAEKTSYQYLDKSYEVSSNVLALKSLEQGLNNKESLDSLLSYLSSECLSARQLQVRNAIARKSGQLDEEKNPITRKSKVQSASEQEFNYFFLRFSEKDFVSEISEKILNLLDDSHLEKINKADLISQFKQFLEYIYPENERSVVSEMREREKEEAEKWEFFKSRNIELSELDEKSSKKLGYERVWEFQLDKISDSEQFYDLPYFELISANRDKTTNKFIIRIAEKSE